MPIINPLWRIILHIDFNCFYASAAAFVDPSLRGLPVAVTGNLGERCGVILAKSYEAKAYGVRTGETLSEARAKCPHIKTVAVDFPLYYQFADGLLGLCLAYSDRVQSGGDDEAYVELTGYVMSFEEAVKIADEIRRRTKEEYGVPCSVGVSFTRTFAKLGSDLKKPDATSVISPANYKDVVWTLPAESILGVGGKTGYKLQQIGIRTIGDIANLNRHEMGALFGKNGNSLWLAANGLDRDPVPYIWEIDPAKSVGNSKTLPRDIVTRSEVKAAYYTIAENIASRLRDIGVAARTVHASLRSSKLQWASRQTTLPAPTQRSDDILAAAMAIYDQASPLGYDIRSLGISCCNLVDLRHNVQGSLLPPDPAVEKAMALERTKDSLWQRFGRLSLARGTELEHIDITALTFKEDRSLAGRGLDLSDRPDDLPGIIYIDALVYYPANGDSPQPLTFSWEDSQITVDHVIDILPAHALKLNSPGARYVCSAGGAMTTLIYDENLFRWGVARSGSAPNGSSHATAPRQGRIIEHEGKAYVAIEALCHTDGRPPTPRKIWWENGRSYDIQTVHTVCWAASERAGAVGHRYTCLINGRIRLLYLEAATRRWFVERPQVVQAEGYDDEGAPVMAGFAFLSLEQVETMLAYENQQPQRRSHGPMQPTRISSRPSVTK